MGGKSSCDGVRLKIAKGGAKFESFNVVIDKDLGAVSEYQVVESLKESTTYHMRIQLYNDMGQAEWKYVTFKTLRELPKATSYLDS